MATAQKGASNVDQVCYDRHVERYASMQQSLVCTVRVGFYSRMSVAGIALFRMAFSPRDGDCLSPKHFGRTAGRGRRSHGYIMRAPDCSLVLEVVARMFFDIAAGSSLATEADMSELSSS